MALRFGKISQLQVPCIIICLVFDEERQFVEFVLGLWGDGWFQVKYVLIDIGSQGGSMWLVELSGRNLGARLRVRIVSSGVCQSVAFLRAGALAHDVYVFGVTGAVCADDAYLQQKIITFILQYSSGR